MAFDFGTAVLTALFIKLVVLFLNPLPLVQVVNLALFTIRPNGRRGLRGLGVDTGGLRAFFKRLDFVPLGVQGLLMLVLIVAAIRSATFEEGAGPALLYGAAASFLFVSVLFTRGLRRALTDIQYFLTHPDVTTRKHSVFEDKSPFHVALSLIYYHTLVYVHVVWTMMVAYAIFTVLQLFSKLSIWTGGFKFFYPLNTALTRAFDTGLWFRAFDPLYLPLHGALFGAGALAVVVYALLHLRRSRTMCPYTERQRRLGLPPRPDNTALANRAVYGLSMVYATIVLYYAFLGVILYRTA